MKRISAYILMISIFCIGGSFLSYAGDINGNEQSVLSVAQGEFEYNGETYRAKSQYVSQLRSYLLQDDVNLSSADAQAAISQIYANVAVGVESGYLEKVGGSSGPGGESSGGENGSGNGESGGNSGGSENGSGGAGGNSGESGNGTSAPTSSQAGTGSTAPSSDGATAPSSNPGGNQNPNQANQSQGQDNGSAGQSAVSPDNQTPGTGGGPDGTTSEGSSTPDGDTSSEGMTSSEASNQQKQEKEVEKPEEIRILEGIAQAGEFTGAADLSLNLSSGSSLSSSPNFHVESSLPSSELSTESQEPTNNTVEDHLFLFDYKTVFLYVLSALLVISIILGIIMFTKHLQRYHYRSKNLRKTVRSVAGVNLAAATFIMLFTAGLGLGVLRDSAFQQSIDETGYYENVYDDFVKLNANAFAFLEVPEEVFENAVSYEQISIAARQQMENDLHRGAYQVNVSVFSNRIKNRVRDYIREQELPMTQSSRKGLDVISQYLEGEYTALFHWKYASLWGGWHEDFMVALRWLLPMSVLLFLAGHLIIISTHHFKHRGIRQCGFGIGAGSAIYLIFNMVTKFFTEGKGAQGETYVDEFLFHFLRQGTHINLLIGLVGICFTLGYLALAKATKEGVK